MTTTKTQRKHQWFSASKALGIAEAGARNAARAIERVDENDIRVDELRAVAHRMRELRRETTELESE